MTLGEAKQKTLRLLDEVTDKNYKDKFNLFFDMGQQRFATQVKPIVRSISATSTDNKLAVPDDLYEVRAIFDSDYKTVGYMPIGDSIFVDQDGTYTLEYNAYPTKITAATPDTQELELSKDLQLALPYFVAAQCVIKESDQRPYVSYTDEMNSILASVSQRPARITSSTRRWEGL